MNILEKSDITFRGQMTPIEEVLSNTAGFEDDLANQLLIEEALLTLPERQSRVVVLSSQGFTQAEIGKKMNLSRTTVWSIKKKALENLRVNYQGIL